MTPVVIDASAGVEIIGGSSRGRRLAALLPADAVGWVPEHFYAEVAGVLRHLVVVARKLTESQAATTFAELERWHLRHAAVAPLVASAWRLRHNLTIADALYVALASEIGAALLTDDAKLANSPAIPAGVTVLRLPVS